MCVQCTVRGVELLNTIRAAIKHLPMLNHSYFINPFFLSLSFCTFVRSFSQSYERHLFFLFFLLACLSFFSCSIVFEFFFLILCAAVLFGFTSFFSRSPLKQRFYSSRCHIQLVTYGMPRKSLLTMYSSALCDIVSMLRNISVCVAQSKFFKSFDTFSSPVLIKVT